MKITVGEAKDGVLPVFVNGEIIESLKASDSYGAIREKICAAINANIAAGIDMDCDDDGVEDAKNREYAYIMDVWPMAAVYSMCGQLLQCNYTIDYDGDVHLGPPSKVESVYVAAESAQESIAESFAQLSESAGDDGSYPVTIIRPGVSKNNRYYSPELLKRHATMFEGVKMFSDHATDGEMKARPEGSVNNWVANLVGVTAESDGTLKGRAVPIDPAFASKLALLSKNGLINQMGVSIRALGESSDGQVNGQRTKIVENFVAVRSVDFVTFAGAGGKVEF